IHSGRVYFYDNLDLAMQLGRETGFPIAFYIFDHQCQTCLYRLGELYFDPTIVAKSRKFINVYVEVPKMRPRLSKLGISNSNLTVQFFLPGMRRLRVLDDAEKENLSHTYDLIFEKYHSLSPEERMKPPRPPKQFRMSPNQYR
ncbi:MAG: hypothetical protein QGG33_03705, partial [Candidatus Krumholzibacteria bacterium]|nr:hypothetical protein [Candidatus Krumholzibacteria bacterium]